MSQRNYPLFRPNIVVNAALGLFALSIFVYSFAFSGDGHPIPAILTVKTGIVPPSKGLSSAFSELVRGNISEALAINRHSLRVFAFFALQLIARGFFLVATFNQPRYPNKLLLTDIALSLGLFIFCFFPLISFTIELFWELLC